MRFNGLSPLNGPDPDFPFLNENERFSFPLPENAGHENTEPSSIIACGGNLSPGMLLSAYEQGLFPWYSEDSPLFWHSPDPRFVLFPEKLHVSASMKKVLKRGTFTITLDEDFSGVIANCARIERPDQGGTWITGGMRAAYTELHRLGWAHSAEAWFEGESLVNEPKVNEPKVRKLAGGCYGIRLGNIFFGESMFSRKPNASKVAFITLARLLFNDGVRFIDCQVHTRHLESLGAEDISRKEFLTLLRETLGNR
jgi:leucyl/phenylalanyl-tRNA--protein transferase